MNITVIGTGYVGLVTGTCLAEVGHTVTCVDINAEKIARLQDGYSHIYEENLEPMLRRGLTRGLLRFSTSLATSIQDAAIIFIAVGTPESEDGSADLGHVLQVAAEIGRNLQHPTSVVVKSTVPIGTCERVEAMIASELATRQLELRTPVISNPEFLREGSAVADFMHPDRVLVGIKTKSDAELMERLYRPFVVENPEKLIIIDRRSSELAKYGANAMLAVRVSFMNELAQVCEHYGANIDAIRKVMGMDPRIGREFLSAGPGYGGSCLPKDVFALLKSGEKGHLDLDILQAVQRVNNNQRRRCAAKVKAVYGDMAGKRLALWGLAFKAGTDDVREAPALSIVTELLEAGALIVAHDPIARSNFDATFGPNPSLTYADTAFGALDKADGLLLLTEWSEYKQPNWQAVAQKMQQCVVFDFRNQYEGEELVNAGFQYYCVGRPSSPTLA